MIILFFTGNVTIFFLDQNFDLEHAEMIQYLWMQLQFHLQKKSFLIYFQPHGIECGCAMVHYNV